MPLSSAPYGALGTVADYDALGVADDARQDAMPPDRILHVHGGAGNALCGNIDDDPEADDIYFDRPLPGHVPCVRCLRIGRYLDPDDVLA